MHVNFTLSCRIVFKLHFYFRCAPELFFEALVFLCWGKVLIVGYLDIHCWSS